MRTFSENFMGDYLLHLFMDRNRTFKKYFVMTIGARGFFAEITTVARAAIYAHEHQLQLVLRNTEFGYRYEKGWEDYYLPFCEEYRPEMEADVEQHLNPAARPGIFMREILEHNPQELQIGPFTIKKFKNILATFMMMICRPNDTIRKQVGLALESLKLPDRYAAVHIRRGDKVGWEDVYYPVDIYLDKLERSAGAKLPIFVMSDDFQAVEEFKRALEVRGKNNPLYSMCDPDNRGFDVWALRAKKLAYRHATDNERVDQQEFLEKTYKSAVDLVVESIIATQATIFLGTMKSNVTKSIWFMHKQPDQCILLNPNHLKPQSK